ncbi:branched-chain amino acid ABC transporter permease [Denitromonas ohlonensis]|jgi:branched-chain amino acid transport system permease protein|uniref:Branched-chain amino acid ABC transporter permease n=2 Tax=Denitromonas TaxID=139331 RepID=A0A558EFX2_9RHOO|nr:branched-chain amino acid ABC transporter permease [Denitromonas ohlonensis]TVT51098.1 MAG: branched-chain amino acid ABC transporter permease [Denitromonas halophila]TVO68423.1 branched-chain amino acid ABC transporter permease [Denitromonas ohlonensis]TVO74701.1 branched-chain amino acid ABC transporter permease [Denitromonas ohlonensis]TVT71247.1 MAG: branched-chain amino acid ABC transporter permease [Denitromonas halophila]TVT72275.1 MAG: branched-chain amino acid ABC transporter perme
MRQAAALLALVVATVGTLGLDYGLGQLAFVATWAIAGLGLVIILGQSGQISLGHGAFLAVGAYLQAGWVALGGPPLLGLAVAIAGGALLGVLASLPGRRLGGLAFGMSTLAVALIVEEALVRFDGLTGGASGLSVPALTLAGWAVVDPLTQFAVSATALALALLVCRRLLNSRLGRAWRAVRDDEGAAEASGIDTAHAKGLAFAVGGALGALAGALYAHWLGYLSPEQFGLHVSFEMLMLVFVGGASRLMGAIWGAVVIVALPQAIALLRDVLPAGVANMAGLELVAFGLVLVAVVLWRPAGLVR